jgi:hypothetical protein
MKAPASKQLALKHSPHVVIGVPAAAVTNGAAVPVANTGCAESTSRVTKGSSDDSEAALSVGGDA